MKRQLTEEQRLIRNQRMKEWREKNKEHYSEYRSAKNKRLTEEQRLKRNEYIKKWRSENKDKVKEYNMIHFQNRIEREVEKRLAEKNGEKTI